MPDKECVLRQQPTGRWAIVCPGREPYLGRSFPHTGYDHARLPSKATQ